MREINLKEILISKFGDIPFNPLLIEAMKIACEQTVQSCIVNAEVITVGNMTMISANSLLKTLKQIKS